MVLDDFDMEEKLVEFQRWIKEQPQLPKIIDKNLLLRYLCVYRFNVEKAGKLLNLSLQIRNDYPHIFRNRDPLSPGLASVLKAVDIVPLLKTTPENYKVCLFRLRDTNPDAFAFNEAIKMFFLTADVRLVTPEENGSFITAGEVPVFDMKGLTLRHLTRIVFSTLRLYMRYTQEAHPVRVIHIHIINCNSFLDKVISLVKPFMRTEVFKMLNFHTPESETLWDFVPKEIFPEEYGGNAGPIDNLKEHWTKQIHSKREYLMNDDNWKLIVENDKDAKSGSILDYLSFF